MGCQNKRLGQAISDLPLTEIFTTRWRSKLEKTAQKQKFLVSQRREFSFEIISEFSRPKCANLFCQFNVHPCIIFLTKIGTAFLAVWAVDKMNGRWSIKGPRHTCQWFSQGFAFFADFPSPRQIIHECESKISFWQHSILSPLKSWSFLRPCMDKYGTCTEKSLLVD